jgi:hypothetical protein
VAFEIAPLSFDSGRKLMICGVAAILIALDPQPVHGECCRAPVAVAGPSRYVSRDPIRLDGSRSYDLDGDLITSFDWFQVSGPEIVISDGDTARPIVSGFVPTPVFQTIEIGLVVGDGVLESAVDLIEVIIVPSITNPTLSLVNPPFRPWLPTVIGFGGGDCIDGTRLLLDETWRHHVNLITGRYFSPYLDQAFQTVVLLSELAPDYRQPIQTVGFSTGGNPAIAVANLINQFVADPRYAVNRVTLLDTYCEPDFADKVAEFNSHPVAGETAWVDVYRSAPEPIAGALNVSFFPGGTHATPIDWYLASAGAAHWPDGDMYNHGVTAGFFLSVAGPARDLQLAVEGLVYYFECPAVAVDCLRQTNGGLYPGLVLEPVRLLGPDDGAALSAGGDVLTCATSEHAARYELLFGPDSDHLTMLVSQTPDPPDVLVAELPFEPTYWTVRVVDAHGSTLFAPPRALRPFGPPRVHRPGRRLRPLP